MEEREIQREQAFLDQVRARVEEMYHEARRAEAEALARESVSPQDVYERDVYALFAGQRRAVLEGGGEGILFGRVDRVGGEVLHIGRVGVRGEDREILVMDWRAPAAAGFYQATLARPMGVVRRRSILVRSGRVRSVEDEVLDVEGAEGLTSVVGEGALLREVMRERTGHMGEIVQSIQAEQDRVIRWPDRGALLVTGGPGTGKTAVALHRVAYLLYQRRDHYARRGVLVVGPSEAFMEYISRVLPALGEADVSARSIGEVGEAWEGFLVSRQDSAPERAVKGSLRMVEVLRHAVVAHVSRSTPASVQVRWRGMDLEAGRKVVSRRGAILRRMRSAHTGRESFTQSLLDELWKSALGQGALPEEYEDFHEWSEYDAHFQDVLEMLWPRVSARRVWEELRRHLDELGRLHLSPEEVEIVRRGWAAGVSPLDRAVVDELVALTGVVDEEEGGVDPYGHVVVDEAQDVTPLEWRMLARRGAGGTWTVVGDWDQSLWPAREEAESGMRSVLRGVEEARLEVNYRTTPEIAEFAAAVLGREAEKVVRPSGEHVTQRRTTDVPGVVGEEVERILSRVSGVVGVIAEEEDRRLLREREWGERVRLVDPWSVKGLEFDGCVVVRPESILAGAGDEATGRRGLYVCYTRATSLLSVVSAADAP